MRRFGLALLVVLAALVIISLFVPKVAVVTVEGNVHHDATAVLRIANVAVGDPFLWVTTGRVKGLAQDPWVLNAVVVRRWPDRVSIGIRERTPALTDGATTWADDGTVLSGATPAETAGLPRLEGWGPARVEEALVLLRLLRPFGVLVISYSPEGFDILMDGTQLFTPSAEALREHWAAFASHRGGRIAVYPWGVSKAHE